MSEHKARARVRAAGVNLADWAVMSGLPSRRIHGSMSWSTAAARLGRVGAELVGELLR